MDLKEYFDLEEKYIKLDLEIYLESKYFVKNVTGYIKEIIYASIWPAFLVDPFSCSENAS